jgi:hypothetical protein
MSRIETMCLASAFVALGLTACAPAQLTQPSATADSVMRAQYAARGSHGAMTGDEAGKIMHGYVEQIGKSRSSRPNVQNTAMGGRAYDR